MLPTISSSYMMVPQQPQMIQQAVPQVQMQPQMVVAAPQLIHSGGQTQAQPVVAAAPQQVQIPQSMVQQKSVSEMPTINITMPSMPSFHAAKETAETKQKKQEKSPDDYDTFIEEKIRTLSEDLKELLNEQNILIKEQKGKQDFHRNLLETLKVLQDQQEQHFDWKQSLKSKHENSKKFDDSGNEILEVFSTRKPKNTAAGLSSGAKTIGKSFSMGAHNMVMQPVAGAKKEGAHGFMKGLAKGFGLGMAIPMGGIATGIYQASRGAANSGVSKKEKKLGKRWHQKSREWYWPQTLRQQEKNIYEQTHSLEKQNKHFLKLHYKTQEEEEKLEQINDFLEQQLENIGDWGKMDGEKYSFLKKRVNEQKAEEKDYQQHIRGSSDQAQGEKFTEDGNVSDNNTRPKLRKQLSLRENRDLKLLSLREHLQKTQKQVKELISKVEKQKEIISKQKNQAEVWEKETLQKGKDTLNKMENQLRKLNEQPNPEDPYCMSKPSGNFKVLMSSAVPIPLMDYKPEANKLVLKPYSQALLDKNREMNKRLALKNAPENKEGPNAVIQTS